MVTVEEILLNIKSKLSARLSEINEKLTAKGQTAADSLSEVPAKIEAISAGTDSEEMVFKGLFTGETTEITFDEKTVYDAMFGGFPSLEKITFSELENFGELEDLQNLFIGTDNLNTVHMLKVKELIVSNEGAYNGSPFYRTLTDVYAPEVTVVSGRVFNSTKHVNVSKMPKLETIKNRAFANFSWADNTSYTLSSVKYLEDMVFYKSKVKIVKFPNLIRLGEIDSSSDWTFYETQELTTVDLGESLEYLNCNAFFKTTTLEKIIIRNPNKVATLYSHISPDYVSSNFAFYVPDDLVSEYETTYNSATTFVFKGLSEL